LQLFIGYYLRQINSSCNNATNIDLNLTVGQNIILAMVEKVFALILGAGGIANLWEPAIADAG
jgi:cation transport ATPase